VVDGAEDEAMTGWPADAVQRVSIKTLVGYPTNARTHSAGQIDQLAASIREWGWTVPVLVAKGWTQKQIKAYRIADNQLALNAAWDVKLLAAELGELTDVAALIGFSDEELQRVFAGAGNAGLTDPDEAPPLPAVPATRAGDLWVCGKHRVLCGDATDAGDVARLLGGVKPNLMVTDPPYGVEYDAKWRDGVDLNLGKRLGEPGSGRSIGPVTNDDRVDWREAYALFAGDIAYVWHAGRHASEVQQSLEAANFTIRCQIVWAKQHFVFSRGDYHWQHEPCWYAVRKSRTGHWAGDRKQTTLWSIPNNNPLGGGGEEKLGHSTQKPVECMRRPIVNNSSPGQAVYDPFVGSGTTMIAAEMEARSALCMEISEAYCDVAVQRWEAFTGHAAEKHSA
jgi:DNA modification methylase